MDLGLWVVEPGVEFQWGGARVEGAVLLGLEDEAVVDVGGDGAESEGLGGGETGVGGDLAGGDSAGVDDEVGGCGESDFGAFDDFAGADVEVAIFGMNR